MSIIKQSLHLAAFSILAFNFSSCQKDDVDPEKKEEKEIVVEKTNTVPEFFPPAFDENYGTQMPEFTQLLDRTDGLLAPNDLQFHTDESRKNELWVLNPGTDRTGAHTVTAFNAGANDQTSIRLQDGNAWHFMALATALAFGDNGNFATSQGILDANRMGVYFTGPTLWTSDMSIYAKVGNPPSQTQNGSHLDMIHQSPLGMGIAHEKDNIYWTFDGFNGTLCRYDFVQPHYPGGPDHSDGKVWRYFDVKLKMETDVPSHMVLDKETNMLYICNTGASNVLKVDITSGDQYNGSPRIANRVGEPLALYTEMENTTQSVFVAEGLQKPCGIELVGDRIFVSDHATGEIHCYNKETGEKLATLNTGFPGIMGITVGPEGKLWFTDSKGHAVYRIDPAKEQV